MEDVIEFSFWTLLLVAIIFLDAVLGTAVGAFTGWVVGLTPLGPAVIKIWFSLTGVECELWELGAFLGFVSGFVKGIVTIKKKERGDEA